MKHSDYRMKFRPLATTHLTFSPCGEELLVNLGGEQIYLFDVTAGKSSGNLLKRLSDLLARVDLGPIRPVDVDASGTPFFCSKYRVLASLQGGKDVPTHVKGQFTLRN